MSEPFVTIIIPAKNSERTIGRCLESIFLSEYNNYEVIVIDDGSTDKTPLIIQKYTPRIQIITNPSSIGPSVSRNRASYLAKGEFLVFTDADCLVDKNWLSELLAGFRENNIAAVGGIQDVPADETEFGRRVFGFMKKVGFITDYIRGKGLSAKLVAHNASCNVAYRRDIFLKESGFLGDFWPGEDVELDYRLIRKGYNLLYNPNARVFHYRVKDLPSFAAMMLRYGYAQGLLVKAYGIFRKIQFLPFLVMGTFLIIVMGTFLIILSGFLLGQVLFTYYFILFAAGLFLTTWICVGPRYSDLLLTVAVFWNLGFFKGLFFSTKSIKLKK